MKTLHERNRAEPTHDAGRQRFHRPWVEFALETDRPAQFWQFERHTFAAEVVFAKRYVKLVSRGREFACIKLVVPRATGAAVEQLNERLVYAAV